MKILLLSAGALVGGVLLGTGLTAYEFWGVTERFEMASSPAAPNSGTANAGSNSANQGATPATTERGRIVVEEGAEHDFGVMERDATGNHVFRLRNTGTAPVALRDYHKTCQCTAFTISPTSLAPGELAEVKVSWKPSSYNPEFRQHVEVEVKGGDPAIVSLTIKGRVVQNLRPVPESLVLGSISNTQANAASLVVYAYRNEHLQISEPTFDDDSTAEFFAFEATPLAPDEVTAEPGAKSGLKISVNVKQGMPLGPIQQTIRWPTNEPGGSVLAVAISGKVLSDVSLSGGARYNAAAGLLTLGPVVAATGAKVEMQLYVRGDLRNEVAVTPGEIDPPEALKLTVGEPRRFKEVVMFPLVVEIPPGSPVLTRLGTQTCPYGKVVLQTTHPLARQVRFFVQFATTN